MGVSASVPALDGAMAVSAAGAVVALLTTYAFNSDNANQFGVQATISASGLNSVYPVITFPVKAGGSSTVTCNPTFNTGSTITTSILCPIANTNIGAGTATIQYQAPFFGTNVFPLSPRYVFALATNPTTVSTTTSTPTATVTGEVSTVSVTQTAAIAGTPPTVTLTGASSTVYTGCSTKVNNPSTTSKTTKNQPTCRPLNAQAPLAQPVRRAAGFAGPDITLRNGQTLPAVTSMSTATASTSTSTKTPTTVVTVTVTNTVTGPTSTIDNRTVTTVSGCSPPAAEVS